MKKLIATVVILLIMGNALDIYTTKANIYKVTDDTVVYEDTKGNLWETDRDHDATYTLGQEVDLTMKGCFTSDITDDIILKVE